MAEISTCTSCATATGSAGAPSGEHIVETFSEESDSFISNGDDQAGTSGERDTTTSEESSSATVVSLLERLKEPKKLELTRKRKNIQIPKGQECVKRHPSCSSNPKSVTASQRVKKFPNEFVTVSLRTLLCEACRQEVSLRRSIIKKKTHSLI